MNKDYSLIYDEYNQNVLFEDLMSKLKKELNNVGESFLNIGYYLSELNKADTYKNLGYRNFNDFCQNEFGLSRAYVYRFIQVYERFGEWDSSQAKLKEEYKEYNKSQLVELVSVPEEDFEYYEPDMSKNEIRTNKRLLELTKEINDGLNINNSYNALKEFIEYLGKLELDVDDYKFKISFDKIKSQNKTSWDDTKYVEFTFELVIHTDTLTIPDIKFLVKFDSNIDSYSKLDFSYIEPKNKWPYNLPRIYLNELFKGEFDANKKGEFTKGLKKEIQERINDVKELKSKTDEKARKEQLKRDLYNSSFDLDTYMKYVSKEDPHREELGYYFNDPIVYLKQIQKILPGIPGKFIFVNRKGYGIFLDTNWYLNLKLFGAEKCKISFKVDSYDCKPLISFITNNKEEKIINLNSTELILTLLFDKSFAYTEDLINYSSYIDGTVSNRSNSIKEMKNSSEMPSIENV